MRPAFGAIDRRTFLLATMAMTAGASAQAKHPTSFSEWLNLSLPERQRAIDALLPRLKQMDADIHAWATVAVQPSTGTGRLAHIPFGVKDVIETAGLPTEYGSPIYKGRRGSEDAAIVTRLRERGAVLVGKTHTTAFAFRTPAPTRNPHDLAHTPGGSSSGSAAAVAAGMVPLAIGTQTGGSTIRPASYCGITGFKASYGRLPMQGVLPFARSLDTLGFYTHTAADMLAFWEAFGEDSGRPEQSSISAVEPLPNLEPPMAAAYRDALARLRANGVPIRSVDIADMLTQLHEAQQTVMYYEGARVHQARYAEYGDQMDHMGELVRKGLTFSADQHAKALEFIATCKLRVGKLYADTPIIVVPAATGPAPRGLSFTGNSTMNSPWTALGTPAVSVPMSAGGSLPLGLQLTADHGQDARVLRAAVRLERLLKQ